MKQVIFDFDGTLVDTSRQDYQIYVDIMKSFDERVLDFETYWELRQNSTLVRDIVEKTSTKIQPYAFVNMRTKAYQQEDHSDLVTMLPDVEDVLATLYQRYDLYVVSMRTQKQGLLDKAKSLNIDRYFTDIVIAPYGKFSTLKRFSELCAVIGDTEYDIDPAQELGVTSIGITTGIRSRKCLEYFEPDYIIDRLHEVIEILCA